MVCIYCGKSTEVTNSRPQKRLNQVWRRRACRTCGGLFTSTEKTDLDKAILVRNGSSLSPFSRDRLFLSLYKCLEHRSSRLSEAAALADTVIAKILPAKGGLIERDVLLNIINSVIKNFDFAAAVRYQSLHPASNDPV